jgi:hypothetical protein
MKTLIQILTWSLCLDAAPALMIIFDLTWCSVLFIPASCCQHMLGGFCIYFMSEKTPGRNKVTMLLIYQQLISSVNLAYNMLDLFNWSVADAKLIARNWEASQQQPLLPSIIRPQSQMQQHGSNRRRESRLWVGINISKICWKKEEEGIRLQIFRFFGGWVWGEG